MMGVIFVSTLCKVKEVRFVEYDDIRWTVLKTDVGDITIHNNEITDFKNKVLWAYEDFLRKGGKP